MLLCSHSRRLADLRGEIDQHCADCEDKCCNVSAAPPEDDGCDPWHETSGVRARLNKHKTSVGEEVDTTREYPAECREDSSLNGITFNEFSEDDLDSEFSGSKHSCDERLDFFVGGCSGFGVILGQKSLCIKAQDDSSTKKSSRCMHGSGWCLSC